MESRTYILDSSVLTQTLFLLGPRQQSGAAPLNLSQPVLPTFNNVPFLVPSAGEETSLSSTLL